MRVLALVLALSLAASASAASAQEAGEVAPEDEDAASVASRPLPFFVSVGLGVTLRLDGTLPGPQMRVQEELGVHFEGTTTGPFAAIVLTQDFLQVYSMQIGIRVGWDLPLLSREFAIVAQPSVLVPFAFDVGPGSASYAYFCPQVALGLALLFLDGMISIWLRPLVFDIWIGENVHGAYTALGGAAFHFGL